MSKSLRRLVVKTTRTQFGAVRAELECGHEVLLSQTSSAGMRRKSRVDCPECLHDKCEEQEVRRMYSKGPHYCSHCGCKLRSGNKGTLCAPCQRG